MKETPLRFTIGAMRSQFSSPRVWAGMGIASLILGLSGPFQTFELLPLGQRLAYWAFMTVLTFVVGSFFGTFASRLTEGWKLAKPIRFLIVGIMAGLPVALTVTAVNTIALNFGFNDLDAILLLSSYSIGISIAVVALFELFGGKEKEPGLVSDTQAPILSRLPPEKRGELFSLSVADHYVEVVTGRGSHLVLMRLSDAIKETQGTPGLQTHRSHWVASKAVLKASRQNGKVALDLVDGRQIPVSRTFIASLKEAGLLPG